MVVRRAGLSALLVLCVALAVNACGMSMSDDLRSTVGLPTGETARSGSDARAASRGPALPPSGDQTRMRVTAQQRDYLDALGAAGVTPSSDLLALSIGSYVCQARAARQSDEAVFDFVVPLVRSDVRAVGSDASARMDSAAEPSADVDSVTNDYIRIATERLC